MHQSVIPGGDIAGKKYRIGVGGLWHESNTFNPLKIPLRAFESEYFYNYWVSGNDIIHKFKDAATHTGGMVQFLLEQSDVEIVPLVCASTTPGGVISDEAFNHLLGDLLDAIRKAGSLDGLVFANHGAMVTESILDADGYILEKVRTVVGADVPIGVALDCHANCSDKIFSNADIAVIYKRYPHIDRHETGRKAAALLYRTAKKEIKPHTSYSKLPIMPGLLKQLTEQEPMKPVIDMLYAIEKEPDILCCNLAAGFPYADVPQASSTVSVISNGDASLAQSRVRKIADYYWSRRREFKNELLSAEEAIAAAAKAKEYPVILADTGDNIDGGTPADGTLLLRLLNEKNMAGLIIIHDPDAVDACVKAGIGRDVTLSIGGKMLIEQGGPVKLNGRVRTLFEGRYFKTGIPAPAEKETVHIMALLVSNKLKIILTPHRMVPGDLSQLRAMGITPEEEKLIVVKAAVAWREFYAPIAKTVFYVATQGYTSLNPAHFIFKNITRPLFPLDDDITWP